MSNEDKLGRLEEQLREEQNAPSVDVERQNLKEKMRKLDDNRVQFAVEYVVCASLPLATRYETITAFRLFLKKLSPDR